MARQAGWSWRASAVLPGWAIFMQESDGLAPSADGEQGPKCSKRTSGSFPSLGTSPSCLPPVGWDLAQHQSGTSQEEVPSHLGKKWVAYRVWDIKAPPS